MPGIAGSHPVQGTNFRLLCCGCNGPCDELITRVEEYYRVCVCVCVCASACGLETSTMRRLRPGLGSCTTKKKINYSFLLTLESQ